MRLQLPHDLIEPAPVSSWPPAPGWWLVAVVLMLALLWFGRWYWRRQRHLAALRQALRELRQLQQQWQHATQTQSQDAPQLAHDGRAVTAALSALLKRVARHYYPDENVAALTGARWQAFLQRTGGEAFDGAALTALTGFYQATSNGATTPPLAASKAWLLAQQKRLATPARRTGASRHV